MAQNNPALDIRETLIADGVTTSISIGMEPPTPHDVITIYNTSGEAPSPKFLLDFPGLQVRSRSTDYITGYNNLLEVFNLLIGRPAFTLNTTRYTGILAMTNIFELGEDKSARRLFACNFKLFTEAESGTQHRKPI